MARTLDMRLTYTNHQGRSVTIGEGPLHWLASDITDHEWDYEVDGQRVWGLRLAARAFEVSVGMMGGSLSARTELYRTMEADAVNARPGRLSWRGFELEVLPVKTTLDKWWFDDGIEERTVTLLAPRPMWCRDTLHHFGLPASSDLQSPDLDYPYDFAHDWAAQSATDRALEVSTMADSEFRLVVWGPAVNPRVTIAGNRYEVGVTVPSGSRLELDTRDRTIQVIDGSGSVTNCYALRTRGVRGGGQYAFQPLPRGHLSVLCDGTFAFDVVVHDERTEPAWEG